MAYLGLDVGTSGCKAVLVNENGEILCKTHREYSLVYPAPGHVELDPGIVWNNVVSVLKEVASYKNYIKYIAVASIGEAMVILDKTDKPLTNGVTYLDRRCSETVKEIKDYIDLKKLYAISGMPLNQMFSLPTFLWFRKYKPEVIEKADKYFLFGDYITYMLSGERAIDPPTASRTMFFDALNLKWSEEIAACFNLPIEKFSKVVKIGSMVGKIRASLAKETGLSEDTYIIMGCHDQVAASLGSGAVSEGDIMAGEGSTESINLVIGKNSISEKFMDYQLCYEPYIEPGLYMTSVAQLTHATCIRWFVHNFGADFGEVEDIPGESIYERADRGCAKDSGNVFFLPYLSGVNCMDASDVALGGFLGVDIATDKAVMYRALLEGLSFESRRCMDILKSAGLTVKNITASGGCSKSELFMQIKSDVLMRPIKILSNPEAGAMGLAIICAKADKLFDTYEDAVKNYVKLSRTYTPDKDYTGKYKQYIMVSDAVKNLYKDLYS